MKQSKVNLEQYGNPRGGRELITNILKERIQNGLSNEIFLHRNVRITENGVKLFDLGPKFLQPTSKTFVVTEMEESDQYCVSLKKVPKINDNFYQTSSVTRLMDQFYHSEEKVPQSPSVSQQSMDQDMEEQDGSQQEHEMEEDDISQQHQENQHSPSESLPQNEPSSQQPLDQQQTRFYPNLEQNTTSKSILKPENLAGEDLQYLGM